MYQIKKVSEVFIMLVGWYLENLKNVHQFIELKNIYIMFTTTCVAKLRTALIFTTGEEFVIECFNRWHQVYTEKDIYVNYILLRFKWFYAFMVFNSHS